MGDKPQKLTGTTIESQNINGQIPIASKITTVGEQDNYTLIDAFNIDWGGYKIGDKIFSYSGDILSYIENSYNYVISELATKATTSDWSNTLRDTEISKQITLYNSSDVINEYPAPINNETISSISNSSYFDVANQNNGYWAKTLSNDHKYYIWSSLISYVTDLNNTFKRWEGPMTKPVLLSGTHGKPASYWHSRYKKVDEAVESVDKPRSTDISAETIADDWVKDISFENGKRTWTTSILVEYENENDIWVEHTSDDWTTPIPINSKSPEAPKQTVLKYTWNNSNTDSPSCNTTEKNPNKNGIEWKESPGNAGQNSYLWMIQGLRQNSSMIKWDTDNDQNNALAYWSSPICLSGPSGEPGEDGESIEFIYRRFTFEKDFDISNINTSRGDYPQTWTNDVNFQNDGYIKQNSGWNDHPTGVSLTYKYEYVSIRKKINGTWQPYSIPVLWSKYSENGLDGDGVEYIYAVTPDEEIPNVPAFNMFKEDRNENNTTISGYQKPEVYDNITWFDDPQALNNTDQKFQWVSIRKRISYTEFISWYLDFVKQNINYNDWINSYNQNIPNDFYTFVQIRADYVGADWYKNYDIVKNITDEIYNWVNSLSSVSSNNGVLQYLIENYNGKIYLPFSNPQLWNWFVNDGTEAPRIVMAYKRTSSNDISSLGYMQNTSDIIYPYDAYIWKSGIHVYDNGWCESPGNDTDTTGDEYLWMIQAFYSDVREEHYYGDAHANVYTLESDWSIPICLTGEPGKDGEDGDNIEFIYYRTGDDSKTFDNGWDNFNGDSSEPDWPFVGTQGKSYYIIDGVKTLSNQDHDTWTDNPFGVDSTFDHEYASVRKKTNGEWGNFCKPFLWSKYGEDGIDGDGVEYIYYLSSDENEVNFTGNILPSSWFSNSDYQTSNEYLGPQNINPHWTDDPSGVSPNRKYEYVSIRKYKLFNIDFVEELNNIYRAYGTTSDTVSDILNNYFEDLRSNDADNYEISQGQFDILSLAYNSYYQSDKWDSIMDGTHLEFLGEIFITELENKWGYDTLDQDLRWGENRDEISQEITDFVNNFFSNYSSVAYDITGDSLNGFFIKGNKKLWLPYSEPALWSKYAEDGIAINLTLDSDNDMMAVAIDNSLQTREASTNTAIMTLHHNIVEVNTNDYELKFLDTNYANSYCGIDTDTNLSYVYSNTTNSNVAEISKVTLGNSDYYKVSINIPANTSLPSDGAFTFSTIATINNQYSDSSVHGAQSIFTHKVIGLSLSTIYQVGTDKQTLKKNANNEINETISPKVFNISDITDQMIPGGSSLPENWYLLVKYNIKNQDQMQMLSEVQTYGDISTVITSDKKLKTILISNSDIESVTFNLIYTNNENDKTKLGKLIGAIQRSGTDILNNIILTGETLVDQETIYVISDGKDGNPGADSKSQEYIYVLTNDINLPSNNYYKPQNWKTNSNLSSNYNKDDFPFVSDYNVEHTSSTSYIKELSNNIKGTGFIYNDTAIGYWTDNPSSVSDSYKYEFVSMRSYDTSTGEWGAFSNPTPWSTWGHDGIDGDGIEYIFELTSLELTKNKNSVLNPAQWIYYQVGNNVQRYDQFQTSEYIPNSNWHDNAQDVSEQYSYQYVSTRRYKLYNVNDFCNDINGIAYQTWDGTQASSTTHIINDSVETLTSIYSYLLNYNSNSNDNTLVTIFKWVRDYCLTNDLTDTDIYSAVNVINENNEAKVSNFWLYNILYFIRKARNDIKNNKKIWCPYSFPKLWSKYAEKGKPNLTIDFTNDTLQLNVNSNGTIKGENLSYTRINLYSGTTLVDPSKYSLSVVSNPLTDNITTLGYIAHFYNDGANVKYYPNSITANYKKGDQIKDENVNSYYFYIYTKEGDGVTDDTINLESSKQIKFKIKYNGIEYYKSLNATPLYRGIDGEPAESFELFISNSEVKLDNLGKPNPQTIEAKVKYNKGSRECNIYNSTNELPVSDKSLFAISYIITDTGNSTKNGSTGLCKLSDNEKTLSYIDFYLTYTYNNVDTIIDQERLYAISDGESGRFKSTVFTLSNTTPDKPRGGEYNNPIPDIYPNKSVWSDGIPEGSGIVWSSYAIFTNIHINGNSPDWSSPIVEKDTDNRDVEFAFEQDNDDAPDTPTISNRHGGSGTQIWYDPTLDKNSLPSGKNWSDMVWRAERERINYKGNSNDWSNWVITRIKGEKGETGPQGPQGPAGNDTYTIDWTNDQINLAIDKNNHILRNQFKYSKIIVRKGNKLYSDDCVKLIWSNYSTTQACKDFGTTSSFIFNTNHIINDPENTNNITISYLQPNSDQIDNSLRMIISFGDYARKLNSYILDSNLPIAYVWRDENNNIQNYINDNLTSYVFFVVPKETSNVNNYLSSSNLNSSGTDMTFSIKVKEENSNWTTIGTKTLRVCGQHTAQDGNNGENAVTYEIVPSVNTIKYNGTNYTPTSLSYIVNKYNGASISQISSWPSNLRAAWYKPNNTLINNNSNLSSTNFSGCSYINLELQYNTSGSTWKTIDRETIPIIDNGEKGSQGFTGPIVRYCGEWKSTNNNGPSKYYNGAIKPDSTNVPNVYYKDIVYYNNKYWTPKIPATGYDTSGNFINIGYLTNGTTAPSTINWTEATQFDFIATKLLYADQALINQISTHDLVAIDSAGNPVAGVTGGAKRYDSHGVETTLDQLMNSGVTLNYSENSGNTADDDSNVRIFAGQIWNDDNSYSLTYAPFNVRQDGTTYMSKANIIGNVNIGGNVTVGNNSTTSAVRVYGDINANRMILGNSAFYYEEDSVILPEFSMDEHIILYIVNYTKHSVLNPQPNQQIWIDKITTSTVGGQTTETLTQLKFNTNGYDNGDPTIPGANYETYQLTKSGLYVLIGGYDETNSTYFWIITRSAMETITMAENAEYVPSTITETIESGRYLNLSNYLTLQSTSEYLVGSSPETSSGGGAKAPSQNMNPDVPVVGDEYWYDLKITLGLTGIPNSTTREYNGTNYNYNVIKSVTVTAEITNSYGRGKSFGTPPHHKTTDKFDNANYDVPITSETTSGSNSTITLRFSAGSPNRYMGYELQNGHIYYRTGLQAGTQLSGSTTNTYKTNIYIHSVVVTYGRS